MRACQAAGKGGGGACTAGACSSLRCAPAADGHPCSSGPMHWEQRPADASLEDRLGGLQVRVLTRQPTDTRCSWAPTERHRAGIAQADAKLWRAQLNPFMNQIDGLHCIAALRCRAHPSGAGTLGTARCTRIDCCAALMSAAAAAGSTDGRYCWTPGGICVSERLR